METAIITTVSVVIGVFYKAGSTLSYKLKKKKIYNAIKESLEQFDYNKLFNAIEDLKKFDIKFGDGCFKNKTPKVDKLEKKFGLKKEDLKTLETTKNYCENLLKSSQKNINNELNSIAEEEVKEELNYVASLKKIDNINKKHKEQLNNITKTLDEFKLSKIVEDMKNDYKKLFEETFNDIKPEKILQRKMVEQFLN